MKTEMILACTGILALLGCGFSSAQNPQQGNHYTQTETLDRMLRNYDRRIRPQSNNGTGVRVQVNLLIRSIDKVDTINMDYTTTITFRQEWTDDRLVHDTLANQSESLSFSDPDRIWKPDIFFQNEKSGNFHNMLVPNQMTRIYPNGTVYMSTRITLVLACPMGFHMFPMDRQICEIRFASYGSSSTDIDLVWKQSSDPAFSPVQVADGVNKGLPGFSLDGRRAGECASRTRTETYKCLNVSLHLQRESAHYVKQFYIPTMMLVIVSWISFWLDPEAITARVMLGILTLLAMAGFGLYMNSHLPTISYTTALHLWTGFCVTFIFLTLLEHAAVSFLNKRSRDKQRRMAAADPNGPTAKPLLGENTVDDQPRFPSTRADKLDFFSRILFPVLFLLFNILYWSIYTGNIPDWPN